MPLHDNYARNLREAQEFEFFAEDTLAHHNLIISCVYKSKRYQTMFGESKARIEFKYDRKFRESGNLFIETAETHHESQPMKESGIFHAADPWLFVIGDFRGLWVFGTRTLQIESKSLRSVVTATSMGVILPIERADEIRLWKWGS